MKKQLLSLGLSAVALSFISGAPANAETPQIENVQAKEAPVVLKGEVGTIIKNGNLIFERVANKKSAIDELISPMASKRVFDITLRGSEMSQAFTLDSDYRYVKVWTRNTSSGDIKFTITKGSKTGSVVSGSSVTIPAGQSWNVYSTNAWSSGTYYANYTSGKVDLSGQSAARLASSKDELDL
ncbi:hypothetical protein ACHADS_04125 [Bacillus vallismortis]|uniref:hypothetical protein n=1 Tax=Bacillus vallismortis TaxID=72361 RepID=UPI00374CF1BD